MPAGWISKAMARLRAPEAKALAVPLAAPERTALLQAVHQALMENDLEAVRTNLEPLLAADPEDREALAGAGILAYLGGQHEVACGALRKAVELDPANGQAHKFLAAALFKLGEDGAALRHAEEARRLLP
jgi:Flp pilus assembly protein TadD